MRHRLNSFLFTAFAAIVVSMTAEGVHAQGLLLGGGGTSEGDLRFVLNGNGSMDVQQFSSGTMMYLSKIATSFKKGSFLFTSSGSCGLGYYSTLNQTPVSNGLNAAEDTATTVIDCTNGIRYTQEVKYSGTGRQYRIQWTITNTGTTPVSDLRFFHGQDTEYSAFETSSKSFYDSTNMTIGGLAQISSQFVSIYSRSVGAAPFAYDSGMTTVIESNVTGGNPGLTNQVQNGSAGHAFEWRNSSLAAGASWQLAVVERLAATDASTQIAVISPIEDGVAAGGVHTTSFLLVNTGISVPTTIDSQSVTVSGTGWSISGLTSNPPFNIGPQSQMNVAFNLNAPLSAALGERQTVTYTLGVVSQSASDTSQGQITSVPATATPTPTSTPTDTPDPTATPAPTATPSDAVDPVVLEPLKSSGSQIPLFRGTAFGGATVTILVDGVSIGTTTAKSDGSWAMRQPTALSFGAHTLDIQAVDPFGRTTGLTAPRSFVVTGGAVLDFDGDGQTDITSYFTTKSAVFFRYRPSTAGGVQNVSLRGRVPAPGDYDNDKVSDFGTIRRAGKTLVWRVRSSLSGTETDQTFGAVGDKPLTNCRFASGGGTSLSLIKKTGKVEYIAFGGTASTESAGLVSGKAEILGCVDGDGDGVDEVMIDQGTADGRTTVVLKKLDGTTMESSRTRKFDRAFAVPLTNGVRGAAAFVRLVSAGAREASFLGSPIDLTIALPRKVAVGAGLFVEADNSFAGNLLWQDLQKGSVFRRAVAAGSADVPLGRIANQSRLVLPSYIYKTVK